MESNNLPVYTIQPEKYGCRIQGPALPTGCWHKTAAKASEYARRYLAYGAGCKVEVYDAGSRIERTFIVQGNGKPRVPFGQMTA